MTAACMEYGISPQCDVTAATVTTCADGLYAFKVVRGHGHLAALTCAIRGGLSAGDKDRGSCGVIYSRVDYSLEADVSF